MFSKNFIGGLWRGLTKKQVCPEPTELNYEGKNIIITGANTGVGFKTAKMMVQTKGNIYLACRNKEKAEKAMKTILEEYPKASVKIMNIDLSSMKSVKEFSEKVDFDVDILINNAGGSWPYNKKVVSKDGYELNVAVNTLCTYYLTKLLLPKIKKKSGRVVYVSAMAHMLVAESVLRSDSYKDFFTYNTTFPSFTLSKPIYQFAISKMLGNMLMYSLHEELYSKTGVSFNTIHPASGGTTMHVATAQNLGSGKYFENGKSQEGNIFQFDKKLQKKIRDLCDEIIKDFEKKSDI